MNNRGFKYVYKGKLTGVVNDVPAAREYLDNHQTEMAQYMDETLCPSVIDVRWQLHEDGQQYRVVALSSEKLNISEIYELTQWVSGQNSDGLGEGFEQQPFAWNEDPPYGEGPEDDEDEGEELEGEMVSFDWKYNETVFELVERFEGR